MVVGVAAAESRIGTVRNFDLQLEGTFRKSGFLKIKGNLLRFFQCGEGLLKHRHGLLAALDGHSDRLHAGLVRHVQLQIL